jgi:pilus assembly protein CpaC
VNPNSHLAVLLIVLGAAVHGAALAQPGPAGRSGFDARRCTSVKVDETLFVTLGKSIVVPLASPVARILVNGQPPGRTPAAAAGSAPTPAPAPMMQQQTQDSVADMDIMLLSPTNLFFRGKKAGSMNVILQDAAGACFLKDIVVTIDTGMLQAKLTELMPEETDIRVKGAENAIVLTGSVSDAVQLDQVLNVAASYGDGKRVVNLLRVSATQQVMLEVQIAEVSKSILDRFGLDFARVLTSADGLTSRVVSGIIGGGPGLLAKFSRLVAGGNVLGSAGATVGSGIGSASAGVNTTSKGATMLGIDAENRDGVVRVLAEPNIMAISGQAASFLSGGKIFIPISRESELGGTRITLEEKEFGVSLKFTPTVLGGSRINLKLLSEVSELSQSGSPFTALNGAIAILPSMTSRRVDTSVQLNDGQSFAVAGLIRNNLTETIKRFPGLGDIPVLGALFRSTEFQKDQTELVFIITPRLVRPMVAKAVLPTSNHNEATRGEAQLMGKSEGAAAQVPQ